MANRAIILKGYTGIGTCAVCGLTDSGGHVSHWLGEKNEVVCSACVCAALTADTMTEPGWHCCSVCLHPGPAQRALIPYKVGPCAFQVCHLCIRAWRVALESPGRERSRTYYGSIKSAELVVRRALGETSPGAPPVLVREGV